MKLFLFLLAFAGATSAPASELSLNPGESAWLRPSEETLVKCGWNGSTPLLRCGSQSEGSCARNYSGGKCLMRGNLVGQCVPSGADEPPHVKCRCL